MTITETRKRKRTVTTTTETVTVSKGAAAENYRHSKAKKNPATKVPSSTDDAIPAASTKLLELLPDVCWTAILSFASSSELSQSIPSVCKTFGSICNEYDQYLWKPRCEDLWSDKVKSSYEPFLNDESLSYCQKYNMSVADSKRCDLSAEELCSFSWAFRFKANAGSYWINSIDPYWLHLKNIATNDATTNTVKNTTTTGSSNNRGASTTTTTEDNSNNNNNNSSNANNNNTTTSLSLNSNTNIPHMIRRFKNNGNVHNPSGPKQDVLESRAAALNMDIKWKLTKTRTYQDGTIKNGNYLSLPRYPSSGIERTNDWGWTMQNQLVAFVYPAQNLLSLHNQLENDIDRWM